MCGGRDSGKVGKLSERNMFEVEMSGVQCPGWIIPGNVQRISEGMSEGISGWKSGEISLRIVWRKP